jgi:hypothetical protein
MNAPNTPREHVERVLHAYNRQRALGIEATAAIGIAAAQLRVPRATVIKALRVLEAAPRTLRLVA